MLTFSRTNIDTDMTWHDMLNAPAGELSVGVEFWNEFWSVKLETHELSWSSE